MATAQDMIEFTGFNEVVAGRNDSEYGSSNIDGALRYYTTKGAWEYYRDDNVVLDCNFDWPEL